MTIAVAGFQHETNTFAPSPADWDAFAEANGWPGLTRGPALFEAVVGINLPITGFVEAARQAGHALAPLLWCSAPPSAAVTADAFERITAMLCADLAAVRGLEAVYLDLHGAMVAEGADDGEGEILKRVRALVGDAVPVVASLDLHANVTRAMAARASALVAYRSYPHVDMAETGARAARLLFAMLGRARRPAAAMRKLPFFIPVPAQCTLFEPARGLYSSLAGREGGEVASISFATGFPPADIAECGPAVLAYGWSRDAAEAAAEALSADVAACERDFRLEALDVETALARALARRGSGPVVLADSQDNPGAGGDSDTVWILEALIAHRARGAVVAMICDPPVAAQAHAAGEGAEIAVRLGARSGLPGHRPFTGRVVVERLGDGRFTGTGPMWRGARMALGPMVLLRIAEAPGVRVIVSSRKLQAADRSIFHHLGVDPAAERILALKSSVHFRADFAPIADQILVVAAPGPNEVDPSRFPYRKLREGVRLVPGGPPFRRP